MNLLRSKGRGDLLRRVPPRFWGIRAADVLVEHAAELVEANGSIVIYIGHVKHLGQRFFRRGLVVPRQEVESVHYGREPVGITR